MIDHSLWLGNWSADPLSALDVERQVRNGQLWLRIRSYASMLTDGVQNWGLNDVALTQPSLYKGIKAKLTVLKAEGNSPQTCVGQISMRANFFNAGASEPNDPYYDVEANVYMYSGGLEGQPLEVGGLLKTFQIELGQRVSLGYVAIGETVTIWVRWDQPNKKVFYGLLRNRKNQPPIEKEIDYSNLVSDLRPAWAPYRSIQAQTSPISSTGYQAYTDMLVKIDQVSVLR